MARRLVQSNYSRLTYEIERMVRIATAEDFDTGHDLEMFFAIRCQGRITRGSSLARTGNCLCRVGSCSLCWLVINDRFLRDSLI